MLTPYRVSGIIMNAKIIHFGFWNVEYASQPTKRAISEILTLCADAIMEILLNSKMA